MKALLAALALLLPATAAAQFDFGSGMFASPPPSGGSGIVFEELDSLSGLYIFSDLGDSLGYSEGDTVFAPPNRAYYISPSYLVYTAPYQTNILYKGIYHPDSLCLTLDGSNDFYTANTTNPAQDPPFSFVFVVRFGTPAGGTIFSSTLPVGMLTNPIGQVKVFAGDYADSLVSSEVVAANRTYILTWVHDGAQSILRVNGVETTGDAGVGPLRGIVLGRYITSFKFRGSYKFALTLHRALSGAEILAIEQQLASTYDVSLE